MSARINGTRVAGTGAGRGVGAGKRWGATESEWIVLDVIAGLRADLVPYVARPGALISPKSTLKDIGKVPSLYNRDGFVIGMKGWPKHVTGAEILEWMKEADYGAFLINRSVRALDGDIDDPVRAREVREFVEGWIAARVRDEHGRPVLPPVRVRRGSPRWLMLIEVPAPGLILRKHVIRLKSVDTGTDTDANANANANAVEALGDLQGCAICGTHVKSGERYEWEGGTPAGFPQLSVGQWEELLGAIEEKFGGGERPTRIAGQRVAASTSTRRAADALADPIVDFMYEVGVVLDEDHGGQLRVICPWEDGHTSGERGDGSTVWLQAGTGGHKEGRFRCLHAHCAGRGTTEFLDAIGWTAAAFDVVPGADGGCGDGSGAGTAGDSDDVLQGDGPPDGGRFDKTDFGNVSVLALLTKGNLRWVHEHKVWLAWRANGWFVNTSRVEIQRAAIAVGEYWFARERKKRREAEQESDPTARKKAIALADEHRKWGFVCRSRAKAESMMSLAAGDGRFVIGANELDQHRHLLGVANGVVDLRTGVLRPAAREDFITLRCTVAFDPDAKCPRFEQFIAEITSMPDPGGAAGVYTPRPELAAYLLRILGYVLTGEINQQKMFALLGAGSNGKSLLMELVAKILGPYALTVPTELLVVSKREADGERATPFVRRLAGVRLAILSEFRHGQKLNSACVKAHTGDAQLTARGLHEQPVTFDVTHKLMLLANLHPQLDHMDSAIAGRIHTLPFDRRWNRPGDPRHDPALPDGDPELKDALSTEMPGVLALLVREAVAFYREGLKAPFVAAEFTREYLDEQDVLGQWLAQQTRCVPAAGTPCAVLQSAFNDWCADNGLNDVRGRNARAFAAALTVARVSRTDDRKIVLYGIALPRGA